jgi:hypothetical protein
MLEKSINWNEIKHLRFTAFVSNTTLALLKEQVDRTLRNQEKDDLFEQFMQWEGKDNEVMLYSDYSLVGLDLPAHFDTIIIESEPENLFQTGVTIAYSILNGWAVINTIEKGHNHVCLLQFENELSETIKCLPEVNSKVSSGEKILIFCNQGDLSNPV